MFERDIPGDTVVVSCSPALALVCGSTLLPAGLSLPASTSKSLGSSGGDAGGVKFRGITVLGARVAAAGGKRTSSVMPPIFVLVQKVVALRKGDSSETRKAVQRSQTIGIR